MATISVQSIKFKYPQSSVYAVDDVSFEIQKGSYTAIVGFNGSGKSSLARVICGLENSESGSVKIEENLLIGMVFQSPKNQIVSGIINRDTAFGPQNLNLPKSEIELRTIESLNVVEMLDRATSSTSALSLGQTQKVALSGIIAIRPDIIILDEATSMLDPQSRQDILDFLKYWHKSGHTVIQITHDLEVVLSAEYVIGMESGKKFFDGTKEEFFADSNNLFRIQGNPLPVSDKKEFEKKQKKVSLSVKNLSFAYNKSQSIKNLSFDLYKGSVTAITGPSGAGKSTILELCSGLLKPSSGKILGEALPVLAQQNASAALFEAFAADDVAFGPRNQGKKGKELKQLVKDSMDLAGLPFEEFGDRQTFSLSGGEQRRLSIAGILALNKEVVFFDEPTAGLDSKARVQVLEMIRKLADSGKTVLFSTHKMDEAAFADREIKILQGEIIEDTCKANVELISDSFVELTPYDAQSMLEGLRKSQQTVNESAIENFSIVKKIPAAIKIVLFLFLFIASLCMKSALVCGIGFIISLIYANFCGFKFKSLLKNCLRILPFLLIFSVFQMIFHPALPDEVHFTTWKWFLVTPSKLWFCLASLLRTFSGLGIFCGFFVSTPEYDLIDGLNFLLKPLTWLKIPVRYFILILEIIFRFIPLLTEEASGIIKTQIIRGGMGKVKGKIEKIKAVVPLIVPMIIQTIKRSEALADAITMRCFK